MTRQRLDQALVARKLAPSRARAQALIEAGCVRVQGIIAPKAATMITVDQAVILEEPKHQWVTRGGLKLAGALEDLGIDPTGVIALDAGCAHGGFTDVLLTKGACHVYAVDVAYGQLDWRLRADSRVTLFERTNIRHMQLGDLPQLVNLVVSDLSFISLTKVLDGLVANLARDAVVLPMVKPQFEVGKERVGKGGVVRNPNDWADALEKVIEAGEERGLYPVQIVPSTTPGPSGNIEFFIHFENNRNRTNVRLLLIRDALDLAAKVVSEHGQSRP